MRKFFFILILLILSVIIAGCGKECMTEQEWRTTTNPGRCYMYSCSKTSDYQVKPYIQTGCTCGDKKCDANIGENECTCIADCGQACSTKPTSDSNLKYQCFDKNTKELCKTPIKETDPCVCLADVDQSQLKTNSKTLNSPIPLVGTIDGKLTYDTPLNLKKSTFDVEFNIKNWASKIDKIYIDSIEIKGNKELQEIKLASMDVKQYVWDENTKVKRSLIPTGLLEETSGEITNIKVIINTKYNLGFNDQNWAAQIPLMNSKVNYTKPTRVLECVASKDCNDGNSGTQDTCAGITGTKYCKHSPVLNVCGNYECDTKENKCICPQDCGSCDGNINSYLYYGCKNNMCVAQLNPKAPPKQAVLHKFPESTAIGIGLVVVTITNQEPWADITKDTLTYNIRLIDITNEIGGMKLNSLAVYYGDVRWALVPVSGVLSQIQDSVNIEIPLKNAPIQESIAVTSLKVALEYEYPETTTTGGAQVKIGNYKSTLISTFTAINPK